MPLSPEHAAANDALEAQYRAEGRPHYIDSNQFIQPIHTDDEWSKMQTQKADAERQKQANAQAIDTAKLSGRKFTTSAVDGSPLYLESQQQVDDRRLEAAAKLRANALTDQIAQANALRDYKVANEGLKTLPATALDKVQRKLKQEQENARAALTARLQPQTKATDKAGWWDVVNNNPTAEATAAQEHLARLSQPDAQLTEDDLAQLEADDATKPLVANLRRYQGLIDKHQTAEQFHSEHERKIADLTLLRDAPEEYARQTLARRTQMSPDALESELQTSAADLETQAQQLQQSATAIQQRQQGHQLKLDTLAQQAAKRRANGIPAGELVNYQKPDGTLEAWPKDLAQQREALAAAQQSADLELQPQIDAHNLALDHYHRSLQLHNESTALHGQIQQQQDQQNADGIKSRLRSTPGFEHVTPALEALDTDAKTRLADLNAVWEGQPPPEAVQAIGQDIHAKAITLLAQGQQRFDAAQKAYRAMNPPREGGKELTAAEVKATSQNAVKVRDQLAAELQISPQEANQLLDDQAKLDWDTVNADEMNAGLVPDSWKSGSNMLQPDDRRQTRTLSNGALIVHPAITAEKDYAAAVKASSATPEAKADALARFPEIRAAQGKQTLETIKEVEGTFGPDDDWQAWKQQKPKDVSEAEWALRFSEKLKGENSGFWGTLFSKTRQFTRGLSQSAADFVGQAAGLGAGLIASNSVTRGLGDESLMGVTQWATRRANALDLAGQIQGDTSDNFLTRGLFSQLPRLAGSLIPAGLGARGTQLATRAFAATKMGQKFLPALSAAIAGAETPAQAVKAVTTLTRAGLGGAAAAGGAQTYAAQLGDIYQTLRKEHPEMSHKDALQQAQMPAIYSGIATALLTTAFGSKGITRLLTQPAEARALADKVFRTRMQQLGFVGKEFLKGGAWETLEESPDEAISQMLAAAATAKPGQESAAAQQALAQFFRQLPELAVATFALGGSGEGVAAARESSVAAPAAVPHPANLPENVAAAESAIDALQVPDVDEAALARIQDAARGVLYIAQGTPLAELDADTLAALDIVEDPRKPGTFVNGRIVPNAKTGVPEVQTFDAGQAPVTNPDGTTGMRPVRVRMIDGQPVISQGTLDKLSTLLPAVRAAIPLDEKQRLQQLQQPAQNTTAGSQQPQPSGGSPAPADTGVSAAQGAVQTPAREGTQPPSSGSPASQLGNALTQELAAAQQRVDAEQAKFGTPDFDVQRNGQALRDLAAVQEKIAKAQQEALIAAGRALSRPASDSALPAEQEQRATELATLLESRGLTTPQALAAAREVVKAQGVVGASAEEQYTAGIDDIMSGLGWVRGTGKKYTFVPPSLDAKPAEAQGTAVTPASAEKAPAQPVADTEDPFAPKPRKTAFATTPEKRAEAATAGDLADRVVVAKQKAMKRVPVASRQRFVKFVTNLTTHLARFQRAFPGGIVFTDGKARNDLSYTGAGIAVVDPDTNPGLEVNLAELFASAHHVADKDLPAYARRAVMHELRHLAALKVITPSQARALWKDLTPALQARIYASYYAVEIHAYTNAAEGRFKTPEKDTTRKLSQKELLAAAQDKLSASPRLPVSQALPKADPFAMAHEFLRMLDEDAEFAGQTSEAMDTNPDLGQAILDFLRGVMNEIKRLIATDLDQSTRVQLREFQKLVEAARKKLLSDNPADRLGSTKEPAADQLASAADNRASVLGGQTSASAVAPRTDFNPVRGSTGIAYTDSNDPIEYQWAVADVNSLTVSNLDNGRINPDYPQELQPRDRTSAASEAQVNDIAKNFNLDRLSASSSVGDGAPIVGPDTVVESGNGRVMGARRAHTTGKPSAEAYKKALVARAAEFGLNAEQVEAVPNPVLIRIRTTEVNRPAFVLAANVSTIAPKREMEQAKIDAKQIVPDLFDTFVPSEDGEIFTAANADFIRAFVSQVIPPAERGQVIDASGNLSQSGLRRIRNALFVNAYGTSPEALNALGRLTESIDATDVNLARALIAMAPRFAEQNARIASGILHPLSITENLAQALQKLSDLRNRGQSIESWLNEDRIPGIGDDPGPVTTALVQFLHENRQRPRQVLNALDRYAKAVDGAGEPRQMSIFGDEKPDPLTLWKLAANHKEPALAMGSKRVDKPSLLSDYFLDGKDALTQAENSLGGSQGLLLRAAGDIADAATYDAGSSAPQSSDDETDALTRFARQHRLMMDAEGVRSFMAVRKMKGGNEHLVSHVVEAGRVLKDLDAHRLATESLYDYLTDLSFSNLLLEDDLAIEGFYQHLGRLHIVTSQPYINGPHPDWPALKAGLVKQGMIDPAPNSQTGQFILPHPILGQVDINDLHTNNAIQTHDGKTTPIDVHFYFDSHAARQSALQKLLQSSPPLAMGSKRVDATAEKVDFNREMLAAKIDQDRFVGPNWYYSTLKKLRKALAMGQPVSIENREVSDYGGTLAAIVNGEEMPLTRRKVPHRDMHFHFGVQKRQKAGEAPTTAQQPPSSAQAVLQAGTEPAPLPPKAALKLYRTLSEKPKRTIPQQQALERAERSLGQLFMFDAPNKVLKPAEDLVLEQQTASRATFADSSPVQLKLFKGTTALDPRLTEAFPDSAIDAHGFPVPPKTLPDDSPLLTPTASKTHFELPADHPLVEAGLLPAGRSLPRKALHTAIVRFFMRDAVPVPAGEQPVIIAMGGGGGAGKSSILKTLTNRGEFNIKGAVQVNADDIKELIPEYHDIRMAGDSRAAATAHEESSAISKMLMAKAVEGGTRYNVVFDGTLANAAKSRAQIAGWQKLGYHVRLVGVTIEPREALIRAWLRAKTSGRWVPIEALIDAHNQFNAAVKGYLDVVDSANLFDNTPPEAHEIAEKTPRSNKVSVVNPQYWSILDSRKYETQPATLTPAEGHQNGPSGAQSGAGSRGQAPLREIQPESAGNRGPNPGQIREEITAGDPVAGSGTFLTMGRKSVRQSMEDWNRDPANGTVIASNYRGGNAWLSPDRRFFHNQEHHYMLPDDVDYTAAMKAGFIRLRPETTPSDGSKTLWVEFYPPLAAQTRALIEDQAAERGMDDVHFDPDRSQTLAKGTTRVRDADYLAAVEAGDMEQAQQLVDEAAKAAGYTRMMYHGTVGADRDYAAEQLRRANANKSPMWQITGPGHYEGTRPGDFDVFKMLDYSPDGLFFFSPERQFADQFRGDWNGRKPGRMIRAWIKAENTFDYHNPDHLRQIADLVEGSVNNAMGWTKLEKPEVIARIRSLGFDSIIVPERRELGDSFIMHDVIDNLAVFNANQIKSAEPVVRRPDGTIRPPSERFDASSDSILRKGTTRVDAGPDLFGFNTGLGLDTLLTPRQKEAKVQQSQTLDLFGGTPNDGPTSTGAQSGSQRREPPRRPSRPPAPPQQSQGSEGLFGDLFSFGDAGQRVSASRLPRKSGPGDERAGAGDVGDGVSGPTDQGATDKSANSPAGDPPGLPAAPAVIPQPENPADRNHRIDAGRNVAPKGNKAKLEANFAAMKLLRELEQQGRNPTPEEKRVLAAYTGWGWIKEAFNTIRAQKYAEMRQTAESYIASKPRWEYRRFDKWQDYYTHFGTEDHERILSWADNYFETHERLKAELSDKEFHAAEKSTLNAHFTTPSVIDAMWQAVARLGFKGGRAMEPGGGIGHFIGVQPENLAQRTQWEATELDDVTARILAKLYPQARVNSVMPAPNREIGGMGFQNARIPNNSLDLFISNVPFAKQGPGKAKSEFGQDFNLHNYFFARALAKVKPGGLVAFITTANTMEASRAQRDYLNNHGQLVAAVRLPNTAFKENAGTEVVTDILILRKPDDSDFAGEPWRERVKVGEDVVTSKRGKGDRNSSQKIEDWLGQIDPEWTPADEALVEPFQAWVKGGRPATGQKRNALITAIQNLHGYSVTSLDFRAPIYVNEYFARHPENILGSNRLVGSMYGPGEYTVTPSAEPLETQLASFVERLPEDIMSQSSTNAFEAKAAERGDKVDSYVERDGKIYQVTKEGLEPVEWQVMPGMDNKTKAAAERKMSIFRQWAKLREAAVALVKLEANPVANEAEMKSARMLLNQVYDRTVERYGPISKRRNNNYRFLEDDPEAPLLAALEDEERTTSTDGKVIYTYHKADIFRRRLIEPQEAPTKAASMEEAVSISMAWEGTLNPQYVADLLGIDASLARQKLIEGGHAFEDPSSGMLMTADEYLSGPVAERLRLAQEAVKDSPQYERNVTALREALPPHKAISEASVILGQRWIPDSIYTAFLRSIGVEDGQVKFSRELNSFEVRGDGSNEEWNVGTKGAKDIFDAVVNNQTLTYYGYVRGMGMQLDEQLTATLRVKADEMRDAFSAFVKTTDQTVPDPEFEGGSIAIPDLAERDFNQKVNGIKPPNYVGDWVKLPGQSGIIWLKPFRRAVLARLITQGRGMMAHGVGSGKTYNQIALAMELRRLGKARKPVIVVQNSTINQFAASFRKAYPQAKILVATPRSYNAKTRARFTARMATGDWDAIILTHSNIDLIPHSPETVSAYFARELEELDAALLASDGSDQQSDLQKARDKLVEKRDEMMAALGERQDDVLNWEDIGVDALIVDEAHAFKNAPVVTNRGRDIKNIPSSGVGSQRAVSMMMKTRSVRERNNQKGVFFATGTPVSNSMAEAFIMLRYIAPDMLEANGIRNFDDFASQYGDVVSQAEATWDGKVKNVDRFAKFVNGQQLINLVRSVFDVAMGNESLGIDVPTIKGGKPRQIIVPATEANMTFNNWVLRDVSPAWEAISRKDLEENPKLSAVPIMTMQAGIAAALDPRLIHDNAPDDPNSKVNTALREVLRIYKASGPERKTAQVIFSDLFNSFNMDILEGFAGHPFEDLGENPVRKGAKARDDGSLQRGNFNLGQDIKAKLIKAGIPEQEIMVVTDQKDEALTNIFDKVNDGDIRIIIGSTGRLGVGVNIQERLAAAHHLMPPRDFKPAMMEQRNGRIIRQGNLHAEWRDLAFVEAVERGGKTRIATKNDKGEALNPSKRAEAASAWLSQNDKDGSIRAAADKAAREFDIEIIEYGVERSLDSAVYSMMSAKQGMIAQVLTSDAVGNEFEDPSDEIRMSMAEMAAHTMGDPDMIRSVTVDKIFRELRAAYDGFQRQDSSRRADVRRLKRNISVDTAALPRIEAEAARYGNLWDANEGKPVFTFGGTTIDTAAKDAKVTEPLNLWITENAREMALKGQEERTDTLQANGQDFLITIKGEDAPSENSNGGVYGYVAIPRSDRYVTFNGGARGALMALRRLTEATAARPAEVRATLAQDTKKLDQLEAYLAKNPGFPRLEELQAIQRERLEIQQRINARNAPPPSPASASAVRQQITIPPLTQADPKLLTPEVKDVLQRAVITDNSLVLPDQLDRKLYEKVNKALESAGGIWSRKDNAHLFAGDPRPYLGLAEMPDTPSLAKASTGVIGTVTTDGQPVIVKVADLSTAKHSDHRAITATGNDDGSRDFRFNAADHTVYWWNPGAVSDADKQRTADYLEAEGFQVKHHRNVRADFEAAHGRLPSLAKASTQVYTPSSYDTAAPDPFTGIPSLITGQRLTREQGRAIGHAHAQRLRAGLPNSPDTRQASPALAASRERTLNVGQGSAGTPVRIPILSAAQFSRLQNLPLIGEGDEAKVYADRTRGTVYKVLQGYAPVPGVIGSPAIGVWPQVYYTANGQLDYAFAPADRPRQLVVRLAVQTLVGGTPTEIVGVGPEGHIILKQPLSPAPGIGRDENFIDNSGLSIARNRAGLVEIPKALLADPQSPRVFLAVVEGRPWLLMDLHPDNFVGDNQAQGRINDAIVGQLPASIIAKVPGLAQLVKDAAARAKNLGDRSDRLFKASTAVNPVPAVNKVSRALSYAGNKLLDAADATMGATSAVTRAVGAETPLQKLGWNHLDRHVSAKLAALARWTDGRTGASQTVAKWTGAAPQKLRDAAHALKREFFPDSVLPREILAKKREMEIKTAMGGQKAMDLVRALSSNPKFSDIAYPKEFAENPAHRRQLYEAMTGERDLATLPKPLQDLANRLRALLIETGREAVKQGRMSTETFDNLRTTYMPHFYEEDVQREKSLVQRFRLGVRDILAQRTTAWHIEDTSQKDSTGQFRLVSHSGNQWRFRNKEHMDAFFEDFIQQQALGELQSRYGKKFRSLTAADLMTPSKLDPEVRGRLQEIKRTLHQRYKRQRPLTIAEQEKAGLIMDPVYAIARYTAQMAHDNSTAEFFNFVASQPALVSDIATPGFTEIPDNPRFGRLAGKFVQNDIAGQLLELIEAPGLALKIYDTILGWWKTGKTVLNPGTHVRNVLGNLFFSQLAGNSVWNPGNAAYYREAIAALRNGGPVLTEAYDKGVLGADFVSAELRQTLRQLLPDPQTIASDGKAPGIVSGIGKAIGRFIGTPAGKAYNNIAALYQAEDEVFKLAAYLKAKAMLPDAQAAAEHVRKWFPYFDSGTSGTLRLIGRTAMPFLGFYRESIRIFGHALKERPVALAAGLAVPSIITALSAMALGLDDDDMEQIRKDMRGKAGKLLGPTPLEGMPLFSMLLPVRSESGQVQQFDISAVHPFVDFLGNRVETNDTEDWWQKTIRSFVAAGPIGSLLYSQMTGRDAFGDRTFVEDNMTGGEKLAARLDNAAKTLLPPLVPGGTGFKTLADAGDRTTNKTFEVRSPSQAALRAVGGLDVRNATPDLYRLADDWRKAHGYEVTEGMDYGSTTPASRARKALFAQLAQDEPNLTAIGNILKSLDKMGHPVRTEQDINRLLFYRDPIKLIGGNKAKGITATDAQAQFRASLQGEARAALEKALQEYQRIKAKTPSLIRRAALP